MCLPSALTLYILPTQCIYVFCVDLRTNSDYFTVQHWLVGFCNWEGVFTARYVLHSTFCPHSLYMCFVWIWEQTAIISLYNNDWLVLITETECIYCAVRSTFCVLPTQCIYVFCVDLGTNSDYFTVQQWLVGFYNWDGVCLLCGTFYILRSAHTVYLCFVWISEQTAIISLYSIDWLVFITETECVYCAVRTGYLNVNKINNNNCSYSRYTPYFFFFLPVLVSKQIIPRISKCYTKCIILLFFSAVICT